jgi:hypothetical protein
MMNEPCNYCGKPVKNMDEAHIYYDIERRKLITLHNPDCSKRHILKDQYAKVKKDKTLDAWMQ